VYVVGHDDPGKQYVSCPVAKEKGVLDDRGNPRIRQQACPQPSSRQRCVRSRSAASLPARGAPLRIK
jgi:hypothetical protein